MKRSRSGLAGRSDTRHHRASALDRVSDRERQRREEAREERHDGEDAKPMSSALPRQQKNSCQHAAGRSHQPRSEAVDGGLHHQISTSPLYACSARTVKRMTVAADVGLVRADSIIRATQDTSRQSGLRLESALDMQFRSARDRNLLLDSLVLTELRSQARLRLDSALLGNQRPPDIAKLLQNQTNAVLRQNLNYGLADNVRLLADRIPLPASSLGMGLLCTQCAVENVDGGNRVWTFSRFPTVGAVEPGSTAPMMGRSYRDASTPKPAM